MSFSVNSTLAMRRLRRWPLAVALLGVSCLAHADWTLGIGVGGAGDPYVTDKDVFSPVPILRYDGERFSASLAELRFHAARTQWIEIDALAALRTSNIDDPFSDREDEPAMKGIERDYAIDLGVGVVLPLPAPVTIEWRSDMSGHDGGTTASVAVAVPLLERDRWSVTSTIGARWLDGDYVNYNYGVRPEEARAARPRYAGEDAWTYSAGVELHYQLSDRWALLAGAGLERLPREITSSPLIADDEIVSAQLAVAFTF